MENQTQEPQSIATLLKPELLVSASQLSSSKVFATEEEAQAAWEKSKAAREHDDRLRKAGYPHRQILALPTMHGPGLDAARTMLPWLTCDGLMFLIGDRGPGKTQIATWIGSERLTLGQSCGYYRKALDLWQEIRATWRDASAQSENEVLAKYRKVPFLVIDEAQERGDTENDRQWCDRMFTHLLDHRYDLMLPTLLCGNLTVEKYEEVIPASVRSRVSEAGGVKFCDWPSYRH